MDMINAIKGLLGVAALAGAGMLTGCSNCEPVREITTTSTVGCGTTVAVREQIAPIGEECAMTQPLRVTSPCDRYFDPLMQSWERPWPFGPYGTANWR